MLLMFESYHFVAVGVNFGASGAGGMIPARISFLLFGALIVVLLFQRVSRSYLV